MEYDNEIIEQSSEISDSVPEVSESVTESIQETTEVLESETDLDRTDEQSEVAEDQNQVSDVFEDSEEEQEEDSPSSTVIQVVEDSETGEIDITELDVNSLNIMSQSYVESMLAVSPTSNDYYDFIPDDIREYFSGIMSQPENYLNNYRAYHLRHWIQNTQYYSYYDDYYYLFYDFDGESAEQCLEIYKANGSSNYQFTWGTAEVLNSPIMYGNSSAMSDLRKGGSYVSEMAVLCSIAIVLLLYIIHAIFKHLAS